MQKSRGNAESEFGRSGRASELPLPDGTRSQGRERRAGEAEGLGPGARSACGARRAARARLYRAPQSGRTRRNGDRWRWRRSHVASPRPATLWRAAMPIIVQGALQAGQWNGRADVLRRVETPSRFGAWSYEVIDTKLARETKGNTVLQLSLYSDLLAAMQGVRAGIRLRRDAGDGFAPEAYRFADYAAYYRQVRTQPRARRLGASAGDAYPEPIEHCDICRWRAPLRRAKARRRSSVPGRRHQQIADRRAGQARRRQHGCARRHAAAASVEARSRRGPEL